MVIKMIFQTIILGFERDIILLLHSLAAIGIFYLALQSIRRIREGKIASSTTGFTLYLLCFALNLFFSSLPRFYPDLEYDPIFALFINLSMAIGIFLFVFMNELDSYLHSPIQEKKRFSFTLSIFSGGGIITIIILGIFGLESLIIDIIVIVVPLAISCGKFMDKFMKLEVVKQSNPIVWFIIGFALSGFSTYFILLTPIFGNWMFVLMYICILTGALLMTHVWNRLPRLSELNWMLKMERLFVIDSASSGVLYEYNFQSGVNKNKVKQVESDIAGSAMGGVDILLGEILSDKGHIKEIDHGDKKVFFTHGIKTKSILITAGHAEEFRYRLEMFHLSFENQFSDVLLNWKGNTTPFSKADDLIRRFFIK